jgi:hypothetical protein
VICLQFYDTFAYASLAASFNSDSLAMLHWLHHSILIVFILDVYTVVICLQFYDTFAYASLAASFNSDSLAEVRLWSHCLN